MKTILNDFEIEEILKYKKPTIFDNFSKADLVNICRVAKIMILKYEEILNEKEDK